MKRIKSIILFLLGVAALVAPSCKTTEANYRAAYEKAIEGRDSRAALENTIYGAHRRNMNSRIEVVGTDTAEVVTVRVRVTEGGGGIKENLKPYSVAVGQFKQLVNAKSMRERLVDAGFPTSFVVETAEPYYYIILRSYSSQAEAVKDCAGVRADKAFPIAMREGMPLVIHCPR